MSAESAQDARNVHRPTSESFQEPDPRQRRFFVAGLMEAGFQLGQTVTLDDETISRILRGLIGLGLGIRPPANRF